MFLSEHPFRWPESPRGHRYVPRRTRRLSEADAGLQGCRRTSQPVQDKRNPKQAEPQTWNLGGIGLSKVNNCKLWRTCTSGEVQDLPEVPELPSSRPPHLSVEHPVRAVRSWHMPHGWNRRTSLSPVPFLLTAANPMLPAVRPRAGPSGPVGPPGGRVPPNWDAGPKLFDMMKPGMLTP